MGRINKYDSVRVISAISRKVYTGLFMGDGAKVISGKITKDTIRLHVNVTKPDFDSYLNILACSNEVLFCRIILLEKYIDSETISMMNKIGKVSQNY